MRIRHARPVGQVTRGKTALNRLRQIDTFIALAYPHLLTDRSPTGEAPLIVDVGYGAQPWTALEMLDRWRRINPRLRLLGLEIEPERVTAALPHADPPAIRFALGGFNVADLTGSNTVRIMRAYNVLRQYDEHEVAPALQTMSAALEPDGLLIEGTSNPTGRMVAFDLYRKSVPPAPLQHEALVFGSNLRTVIEPADFQTILPKRLIHRMLETRLSSFFNDWKHCYALARGNGYLSPRRLWVQAGSLLRTQFGYPIDPRQRLLRRGYLVVHHPLYP